MNFIADVSTAQIAELVVTQDGSVADGSTANTLRVRVHRCVRECAGGQTVSVTAGNGGGGCSGGHHAAGRHGGDLSHQPDEPEPVRSPPASTTAARARNVTFVADVRTAKIADLVVTRDNSVADGSTANTLQVRVTDAFGNALNGQTVSVLAWTTVPTTASDGSPRSRTARWKSVSPARRRESVLSLPALTAAA
ncbi:hypothetical protein O5623_17355 [Escherichia coli]|nr:hypothetical protein [Escherichia coli]